MTRFLMILMVMAVALTLVACSSGSDAENSSDTPAETSSETQLASMNVELGCGSCTYKMDGVEGCVVAASVDGTPMLVEGSEIDAHSAGLCSATKMAEVTGSVSDGKLMVTQVVLE